MMFIPMTRMAMISTEVTGGELSFAGPEGTIQMHRVDPHGVLMSWEGRQLSVHKELTPVIGRYFLAAGLLLGMDINDGWDGHQHAASHR